MSKIDLDPITSGYNLSKINANFQKVEDELNNKVLYRNSPTGEPNSMSSNLDMNGNKILNVVTGTSPSDLATRGYVDEEIAEERVYVDQQLYLVNSELDTKYDKTGGPVFGDINLNGHKLIGASEVQTSKTSTSILEINGVPVVPGNSVIDPYNGTREALRRSYAEAGYTLVDGSFEAGGTLVNANDVLLQERTGKAFSGPAGTVAAGTNPASGGFVDKSGGLLRHELATSDGAAKVGNANGGSVQDFIDNIDQVHTRYFDNVDAMLGFNDLLVGRRYSTGGSSWEYTGFGDGTIADFKALGDVNIMDFGAVGDGVTDDSDAIQKALTYAMSAGKALIIGSGHYLVTKTVTIVGTQGAQVTIRGQGYGNNYLSQSNPSTIVAKNINGPVFDFDITTTPTSPQRFTLTLEDFNIYNKYADQTGVGIRTNHCWYSLEKVGIKGFNVGFNSRESYRGSINKSSITENNTGILFTGYHSVQTITDNQLRYNYKRLFGFDTPGLSINPNNWSQSYIAGNNMESNPIVFDFENLTNGCNWITVTGNYLEKVGNDGILISAANSGELRNFYFTGGGIAYTSILNKCNEVHLTGTQLKATTTINSSNVFIDNRDSFNGIRNSANNLPKSTLTTDSSFHLHSDYTLSSGQVILPLEYRLSTVSNLSWADVGATVQGKKYLKVMFNGSDSLRLDFAIPNVSKNIIESDGLAYRLACQIRYKIVGNKRLILRGKAENTATKSLYLEPVDSDWHTRDFTIDVSQGDRSAYLVVNPDVGNALEVHIDSITVACVSNPIVTVPTEVTYEVGVANGNPLVVTGDVNNIIVTFLPNDNKNNIVLTGQRSKQVTITHVTTGTSVGILSIRPAAGSR